MTTDNRSWLARHKGLLVAVGLLLAVTVIAVLAALNGPGHDSSPVPRPTPRPPHPTTAPSDPTPADPTDTPAPPTEKPTLGATPAA